MESTHVTYIGVDLSTPRQPCSFAVLDDERRILAQANGPLRELVAYGAGQSAALIAIGLPPGPLEEAQTAEGLALRSLAGEEIQEQRWLRNLLDLVRRLDSLGFRPMRDENAARRWFVTQPDSCYWAWLGVQPLPARTLEGRLQRQLALEDQDLPVPDAMDFFEEITRHRLLHGVLPLDHIFEPGPLGALAAAQTAWLTRFHPEQVTWLGSPDSGQLALPANPLPRQSQPERAALPSLFPLD